MILTKSHLTQIIGDPQFYMDCPTFLFMREQGLSAYEQHLEVVQGGPCKGCDKHRAMTPAIHSFVAHLTQLRRDCPTRLEDVRKYLKERGVKEDTYAVIYKDSDGRMDKIVF